MTSPRPAALTPDFEGGCLANVVPTVLSQLGALPGGNRPPLPGWAPPELAEARQVVLLVLDGLGWEQLRGRPQLAPTLAGGGGAPITSVAPSTTAVALTSLATGLPPAVHGVLGYRFRVDGSVLNVLTWRTDEADARQRIPAERVQPYPCFGGFRADEGGVPVVSRSDYATTGFTAAHLAGSVLHPWFTPSGIAVEVRKLLAAGEPFVYAYYDGIDRVSHGQGLGPHYDAELRTADLLVADVLSVLPPGAALVVTADHGQVEVGQAIEVLGPDVMEGVELVSGEGRFRWLHTREGARDDVAAAAEDLYGKTTWVLRRDEVISEGWLGGEPLPAVADRLGDVALVPFEAIAFLDPADTGEQRLVGRHGSLTPDEMLVPLIAWLRGA